MSDLDHLCLNVADYARSKAFYEAALAPLGMSLLRETPSGAGFGRTRPQLWIREGVASFQQARQLEAITPVHVSLSARTRDEVIAFHTAALAAGARDFGAPGLRPEYHPHYFGAFVLDPDGHDLEAVTHTAPRAPIVLPPDNGRRYPMGRIGACFKADRAETAWGYSISEWWLDAHTRGPGAHQHPEDDAFFVIEGTMTFLLGETWIEAPRGTFVLAPGGTPHDFENRTSERAGLLNFSPTVFEPEMESIAAWFREHPPGEAR